MFHHAFTGYMSFAYPADELRPITCAPLLRDPNPANIGVNDIHANISMTLVDSLSALPLILPDEYPAAVERIARISFDQDVKVQVFEMTIRALGALLSAHQRLDALPEDPRAQAVALGIEGKADVKKYAPRMLELALDLGTRLLPAFDTPTGLPYARVNLRNGVEPRESTETCTAGAGSLVLEFTLLSRLTGDERFEVSWRASAARPAGGKPSGLTPGPRSPRVHGALEPADRRGPRRQRHQRQSRPVAAAGNERDERRH